MKAPVLEVFRSFQGEGAFVGVPQVFVRFRQCNMTCVYCDEMDKMQNAPWDELSPEELTAQVCALGGPDEIHSVSVTGGEPLLYTPFLRKWLPQLKALGYAIYLETNGTLPEALARVIEWVDWIAMDLKPSSSTGDRDWQTAQERFLRLAGKRLLCLKLVVSAQLVEEDVRQSIEMCARSAPQIPFILQPATPARAILEQVPRESLQRWQRFASEKLSDVRTVPQTHKLVGWR
ncbi:MAG: 7-carboxy-7-deazaguanine synthase QueE [Candidatus Omnitrophica bacterium]|nr:7-carboxy-7-deazaguanine synthase QueE [Candidatus Omnitrophota bacterium]